MSGGGRKDASEEFFNQARTPDAFRRLFPHPFNKDTNFWRAMRVDGIVTSAKAKRVKGEADTVLHDLENVHDTCFVIWEDPETKQKVKRIGYWGQCLAFGVLWSLVQKMTPHQNMTTARLSAAAIDHGKVEGWIKDDPPKHPLVMDQAGRPWGVNIDRKQDKLCLTYQDTMTLFLKTRQEWASIPCVDMAMAVHRSLLSFVFQHLAQSEMFKPRSGIAEEDLVCHLDEVDYASPMACFDGMVAFLDIAEQVKEHDNLETVQVGQSWIEPSIWRYVTSNESDKRRVSDGDINRAVSIIDNTLRMPTDSSQNARRFLVLTGNTHSGKKAVIGDFLKLVHDRSSASDLRFEVQNQPGDEDVHLPVLCLQTKDRDAVTICIEVLVFLQRLAQSRPRPQDEVCQARWAMLDQSGSAQRLSDLLSLIREAHQQHPALIMFLDVQPTDNTDTRNLMNKMRMDNLINALNEGHKDSRFVVTTQDETKVMGAIDCTPLPLERPTFRRLAWYLNDKEEKAFTRFANAHDVETLKGRKVDGNILMVLSVLFSEESLEGEAFLELVDQCVNQTAQPGMRQLDDLCVRLISIWEEKMLLPYLALILASDDGMMESTLKELMEEWREWKGDLRSLSVEEGVQQLNELNGRGRGLFLRQLPAQAFIEEELRFSENDFFENPDNYKTWNFDSALVTTLRRLMSEGETTTDTMRQANRLVAKAARSRARYQQLKGVTVRREYGPRLPERSVQAYVSLMLSMKSDATYSYRRKSFAGSVPLPLATEQVFSLDEAGFNQSAALRYAYNVLIGEEADPKHKLSMTLDADVLRLQLFTLLCANPGSIRFWDDNWYVSNQGRLPDELAQATLDHFKVFPQSEQADILVSLGMAAFYCNHRPILTWAQTRLFEIRTTAEPLEEQLSRLVCARVDIACQIGQPIQAVHPDQDEQGQEPGTLVDVRENLRRDIESICSKVCKSENIERDIGSFGFPEISAWLRLQTRLLHLDQLIDPTADPEVSFGHLVELENKFLVDKKSPKSIAQHGRTGRIQVKCRIHHFPILLSSLDNPVLGISAELKVRMRTMVHANVSRLSQFSGAERALTLNDHARFLMLDGQKTPAVRAVNEARRVAFQGLSSDGTRLEVLMLECAIQLALVEAEEHDTADRQSSLLKVLSSLALLHRMLSANDLEFEKVFMHVLAWRACQMGPVLGVDLQRWDASDQLTLAIERAREHEALGLVKQLEALRSQKLLQGR